MYNTSLLLSDAEKLGISLTDEQIKLFEKQCERMDALRKEIDRLKLSENKLMSDLKVAYVDISKLKGDLLAKEYENMQAVEAPEFLFFFGNQATLVTTDIFPLSPSGAYIIFSTGAN